MSLGLDAEILELKEPLTLMARIEIGIAGGDVIGIICHEHVGPPRTWTAEECRQFRIEPCPAES